MRLAPRTFSRFPAAFTLLELLIAIAACAIVLTAIFGCLARRRSNRGVAPPLLHLHAKTPPKRGRTRSRTCNVPRARTPSARTINGANGVIGR